MKRLMGGLALTAGAVGSALLLSKVTARRKERSRMKERDEELDQWARPNMRVTFRAELMPGRDSSERTFRVAKLLTNNRVLLDGVAGEHSEKEFEPVR